MAKYLVTDTELKSVADAIRTKGGTEEALVFPNGFVSAIETVPGAGNIEPITITENGTYTPPSGINGYAPVTVNVTGGFQGDGREYLFDWSFDGSSGYVHVTKDGVVTIGNNNTDEINGDYIYKASNSPVVTAKTNCYAKVGNTSSLGTEDSFATNDSISASISGYERLIIAYDQSGQTSQFEVGFGWVQTGTSSDSISTQRCIIKTNGTFVPHSASAVTGDCVTLPVPLSIDISICACRAVFIGALFYYENNNNNLTYKKNYTGDHTIPISYPVQTSLGSKSYIAFALANS